MEKATKEMKKEEKRPRIAITASYDGDMRRGKLKVSGEYFGALWDAGALPVYLQWVDINTDEGRTRIKEYACSFDGFLFSGGVDLDPALYGDTEVHETVTVSAQRDDFELALFREVSEKTNKAILGICRGMQLANVALGGSLNQHIEGHQQKTPNNVRDQRVEIAPDSMLAGILSDDGGACTITVNTFHHQSVKLASDKVRVVGVSDDGTAEAIEGTDGERFLLAVQWHPELYYQDDEGMRRLFRRFVEAAK